MHDIVGLRLNAVLIGHKSQKYVKYHYKRNVYNWQCVMKRNLKGMVISNELVQNMSNNYIAINEQVRDFA